MLKFRKVNAETDPNETIPLIRRLFGENLRTYLPQYALAFVFMGFVAATTAASAWIMRDVVNEVFVNRDQQMVYVIAGVVMLIFAVKGVSTYGQLVVLARVGNAIIASLQKRLFDHILQLDQAYYDRKSLAEINVIVTQGVNSARMTMDMVVVSLGRDLLTLIGLVIVMVVQNPLLSFFAFVIMPPAVIGVAILIRRVKKHMNRQVVSTAKITAALQETVLGVRVVKAFGMEDAMRGRMGHSVEDVERQANKIATLSARTSPMMDTLGGFAIAMVIFYGGYSVVELGQDPGSLFSFITALLLAYDPARRLARLNVNLGREMVGLRLMYDLIDERADLKDRDGAKPLAVSSGEIVFDDVRFSYGDGAALSGASFKAEPGKMTALVGASGAGKSTVFSLIERFYDPQSGEILIDGQPVQEVQVATLRRSIAYVGQDAYLFNMSLRENIGVGVPGATEADIIEAAKAANAHDFITTLPDGYNTSAGEGGNNLSGGQRQRIAIARAMLRDAPILLLDEATSALDAESEAKIQSALETLMTGRTTLVIAHRLSTVRHAHQIHVMDQGRVVESGTHDRLYDHDGIYRRLCDLQFQDKTEAAE
ncbi:ABC transporter ATP-binding protein [Roseibium alexandrii]|uniref:ABC-type multidrug transport system, ATPase and permease component n=1 Tax=Roseibium alexandrii (strain DSM 17067 / NCIMB 14079 / DFL-11) TaxID=244592 RepID=A0A5E8H255_ROSAD|nr:ABC transporter ATP-binding protein [Roseibium alexandrii]EEE46482.2 ABC-type multidrug transport system, ATPase and permease component [Roseibium alexandrii DFL-11]